MSYILDALKKSDQQRQRGTTPTLSVAQVTVSVPERPMSAYYGLLAAVLLVAGIVIGWLRPWQPEQTPVEPAISGTESIAARSTVAVLPQQTLSPLSELPETPGKIDAPEAAPIPEKTVKPIDVAQEAMPLNELPLAIRQELPAMTVQLHAYSGVPAERLVSINSIRLRERESLMLGLKLEQITPDGMIFSYKGYRFRQGLR